MSVLILPDSLRKCVLAPLAVNINKMIKSKNKNLINNLVRKRGFSIGEAILSVFILGITMLTILSLYSQGLHEFQDERDSIIASMLAQEGVEIARNIRDNNWAKRDGITEITPRAFDLFDTDISTNSTKNDCIVSYKPYSVNGDGEIIYSNPAIDCNESNYVLNINPNGFYTHESGSDTKFRRRLLLDYRHSEKRMIVTSLVSWDNSDPPTTNLTINCVVGKKCVFSQTTLTEWGTGT